MEQVTPQAVAEFVGRIAPMYVDDPVTVEPLPIVDACPWAACVVWAGRRWHILADSKAEPKEILRLCFHELYHVLEGHITPALASTRPSVAARRAMARGVGPLLKKSLADMQAARAAPTHEPRECGANDWAAAEVAGWWPTLESWKDPIKAARVAWQVHNELKKQKGG